MKKSLLFLLLSGKKSLLLLLLTGSVFLSFSQTAILSQLTENRVEPLGLDVNPRFTWLLKPGGRNQVQTAYELKVLDQNGKQSWSTGKVNSDQSVLVNYAGPALESGKKYSWQVRIWDQSGKAGPWSAKSGWQMGMLNTSDWKAKWIEPGFEEEASRPSPVFRKQFQSGKKIKSATAFITAHGLYEAYINGKRVGDDYFTPGWTSYKKRLQYQVYDVTSHLENGANVVGVMLGSGWYRGILAWGDAKNHFGKDIALLMQINIEYADGSSEIIATDDSWKSAVSHIRYSEIYNGETSDSNLELKGWDKKGYNDSEWKGVKVTEHPMNVLVATYNEGIKKKETFKPVKIFKTPAGEQVIDFGQNLVGWVVIKASGKKGDTLKVSHAEVLDKQGNFYITNLRAAKSEDNFILSGQGEETLEPRFTWHGFRYIQLHNYPGEIKPENFTAVALYSDMKPTGEFSSSNELINQLQKNIQWGQKGNFLDVPTDCPQRDERLGWTGDAQVFVRTAAYNMNVHSFFSKWMKDVAADQVNGAVPFVVPNVLGAGAVASTGWADVATIAPWQIYQVYGDKKILTDQYESMKAWVEYMRSKSTNDLWNTGFHFGDWLFYRPEDDNDGRSAVTDKYLIAQSFFAHSTQLLINTAKLLGREDDVKKYSDLLEKVKTAFRKEYVTPGGRLVSSTQTAYVLALHFDMLPEEMRASAAKKLAENVKSYGDHLTTGFLGTPYLCHVLTRFGYNDVAYKLLMQETYPSWLYPVKMGATTIWERWDGIKPDSTFQTPGMNSYNHYAYGAIGDWMYRVVSGINTDESKPGYKQIMIKPHPGGGLQHANASLNTYYGKITSNWKLEGEKFSLDVTIPPNTKATVYVPGTGLMEDGKKLTMMNTTASPGSMDTSPGSSSASSAIHESYVPIELGSGEYHFSSTITKK
ncbi:MAG: family 78 glycoside hydrolase catalytic domain [Flavitalea sp.]